MKSARETLFPKYKSLFEATVLMKDYSESLRIVILLDANHIKSFVNYFKYNILLVSQQSTIKRITRSSRYN